MFAQKTRTCSFAAAETRSRLSLVAVSVVSSAEAFPAYFLESSVIASIDFAKVLRALVGRTVIMRECVRSVVAMLRFSAFLQLNGMEA